MVAAKSLRNRPRQLIDGVWVFWLVVDKPVAAPASASADGPTGSDDGTSF